MYHDFTHTIQMFANQNVMACLGYVASSRCAQSCAHAGPAQGVPNSFNFLYHGNQSRYLVCQPQIALGGWPTRVNFNPNIAPFEVQI